MEHVIIMNLAGRASRSRSWASVPCRSSKQILKIRRAEGSDVHNCIHPWRIKLGSAQRKFFKSVAICVLTSSSSYLWMSEAPSSESIVNWADLVLTTVSRLLPCFEPPPLVAMDSLALPDIAAATSVIVTKYRKKNQLSSVYRLFACSLPAGHST